MSRDLKERIMGEYVGYLKACHEESNEPIYITPLIGNIYIHFPGSDILFLIRKNLFHVNLHWGEFAW